MQVKSSGYGVDMSDLALDEGGLINKDTQNK